MKQKSTSRSAFLTLRILLSLVATLSGAFLALFATSAQVKSSERAMKLAPTSGGVHQDWIAFYNGEFGFDVASGIAVDASGNIYVTGSSVGPGSCNFYCN